MGLVGLLVYVICSDIRMLVRFENSFLSRGHANAKITCFFPDKNETPASDTMKHPRLYNEQSIGTFKGIGIKVCKQY